jgi:outer membrane protein TolC
MLFLNEKKIKSVVVFCCCFLVLLSSTSYCDDEFLRQCLKVAQSRDSKLYVAQQQIELSKIRVLNAGRGFFPQIQLQYSSSKGDTALANSGSDTISDSFEYQSVQYGIRMQQPIYEGFRTKGTYEYESMSFTLAKINYTKIREELFANIKTTYYEYLTAKKEYRGLRGAFEIVEGLVKKVHNEYRAKAISQLDVLEAENFRDKVSDSYNSARTSLSFSIKKLIEAIHVNDLSEIPGNAVSELPDDVPEINYTLKEMSRFIENNNLEILSSKIQAEMADMKILISRSKIVPKFYLEGFYGKSGEAFVSESLDLSTSWTIAGKMSWSLWGNSLEASYNNERADPATIVDASRRLNTQTLDLKLSLLDDFQYFVESKESVVTYNQSNADYLDALTQKKLELEKQYNRYMSSLRSARTLQKEVVYRARKVELMKKRNELFEATTVQLMDETWQYAEAIQRYSNAVLENHAAVIEMENITLTPLR